MTWQPKLVSHSMARVIRSRVTCRRVLNGFTRLFRAWQPWILCGTGAKRRFSLEPGYVSHFKILSVQRDRGVERPLRYRCAVLRYASTQQFLEAISPQQHAGWLTQETLLDDLCESVGREGVAEVDVGSYHGIGQHHDRRPFLRQVAHEALVARYRAIVTDKPAEAGEFIHPKPVVAYPAESLLLCCCAYHLASSQRPGPDLQIVEG